MNIFDDRIYIFGDDSRQLALFNFSKRDIMRHTQQTVFQMITKKSNTLTTFLKTTYAPELIS